MTSVEKAFRPAFEEIARRSGVARSYAENDATYFGRSDGAWPEFELSDQEHVLVSMGTAVLAPRPVDVSRPALRVYGAFRSRDDAVEHAEVVREVDPACSLVVVRRGEWVLMPQNERMRDDREANELRVTQKLEAYRGERASRDATFDECVREHVERPSPRMEDPEPEDQAEQDEAEACVYKPPKRLRAGAEVRGQSSVALCVVPDEYGECLFNVLGCFENTPEADEWVSNTASRRITYDDIFVAPTCEWLYPNATGKGGKSKYRIDELQRIMDAAERNPEAVKSYKEWKRQQDEMASALPEPECTEPPAAH